MNPVYKLTTEVLRHIQRSCPDKHFKQLHPRKISIYKQPYISHKNRTEDSPANTKIAYMNLNDHQIQITNIRPKNKRPILSPYINWVIPYADPELLTKTTDIINNL